MPHVLVERVEVRLLAHLVRPANLHPEGEEGAGCQITNCGVAATRTAVDPGFSLGRAAGPGGAVFAIEGAPLIDQINCFISQLGIQYWICFVFGTLQGVHYVLVVLGILMNFVTGHFFNIWSEQLSCTTKDGLFPQSH